jgi:hypothetical protein
MKGNDPLVKTKNKPAVTSLREIAAGRVHFSRNSHDVVNEWVIQQHAINEPPRERGCPPNPLTSADARALGLPLHVSSVSR